MTEAFDNGQAEDFLVFELEDSGEKTKLDINQDELQSHLNPEQVFIIIREDLRRIFIWKGSKSPVRKRFISSRVAQQLQKELMEDRRYHRCKIVSIDQGDELQEFLNAFKLESMEATERLPDMRYIRNIERDKLGVFGQVKTVEKDADKIIEDSYYSLALGSNIKLKPSPSSTTNPNRSNKASYSKYSSDAYFNGRRISSEEKQKIKEKILNSDIPANYIRQNLILGHTLYGAASKVVEVFGKNVEETKWEEIKKVPKSIIELDGYKLKVHFNEEKGIVEAVEVLKHKPKSVKSKNNNSKLNTERSLPKIPKKSDN